MSDDSIKSQIAAAGVKVPGRKKTRVCELAFETQRVIAGLPEPVHEYQWDLPRSKRHVDYAWPGEKTCVEINEEGFHRQWSKQSEDARKALDLALAGWVLLPMTGAMLRDDPGGCMDALRAVLAMRGCMELEAAVPCAGCGRDVSIPAGAQGVSCEICGRLNARVVTGKWGVPLCRCEEEFVSNMLTVERQIFANLKARGYFAPETGGDGAEAFGLNVLKMFEELGELIECMMAEPDSDVEVWLRGARPACRLARELFRRRTGGAFVPVVSEAGGLSAARIAAVRSELSDMGVVLACMGRLLASMVGHETGAVMEGALHKSARDVRRGIAGKG